MSERKLSKEHLQKLADGRAKAKAAKAAQKEAASQDTGKAPETAEDEATPRPKRLSLRDKHRNVLTTHDVPPGYVGRWVNDHGTRTRDLRERGYMFVLDTGRKRVLVGDAKVDPQRQTGTIVSKLTKQMDASGRAVVCYLMAQRQEDYDEDQAFKQEKIAETEKQLRRDAQKDGLVSTEELRRTSR